MTKCQRSMMLGDGDFVEQVLSAAQKQMEHSYNLASEGYDLDKVASMVCDIVQVEHSDRLEKMKEDLNMPLLESKKINRTSVESRTLSNVQMELIKLYSTDLEYNDLMEVKKILANHFAQKAIDEADNIWNQKKMSADTMED